MLSVSSGQSGLICPLDVLASHTDIYVYKYIAMSLVLVARFKNESHIMYEFIHHYLYEGVDHFILIDDGSDDNYLQNNPWLGELVGRDIVAIHNSTTNQIDNYDVFLDQIKQHKWAIVCDMDEFMFSVDPHTRLIDVLDSKCDTYDYIKVYWKMFTHTQKFQPVSVIDDATYTHHTPIDPSSPSKGIKCIAKTQHIAHIDIHWIGFDTVIRTLDLDNCHNDLIQSNHYAPNRMSSCMGSKNNGVAG
jgi:hypothetical protein